MNLLLKYLYNLALGLDQFLNVILLGDPDESLSGRMGRAKLSGRPKWFVPPIVWINDKIWLLLAGEVDHSINAVEPEERPKEKEIWSWTRQE